MKGNNLRVFIVDDEEASIEWMLKNVEWEVYNCNVVGYTTNPVDALRYLNEHPVDLLLTDISMPTISGLEIIKSVKECFPEMLIIVISAYDKFSYVKEAFQCGIINYCLKPIDINEMQKCLETAMKTFSERKKNYYDQDRRIFRNGIFLNLIAEEISAVKFKKQSEAVGIDYRVAEWQVVLMDISVLEEDKFLALLNYYRENEHKGYYCFLDSNMNLVFILYGKAVSNEALRIQKLLKGDIDVSNIFLCIGEPLTTYHQIPLSYQVCLDFLNANFIFHKRVVQTGKYSYEKYFDILKGSEYQQLIKKIKSYDRIGAMKVVEEIINKCRTEEEKSAEAISLSVFIIKNMIVGRTDCIRTLSAEYLDSQKTLDKKLRWMDGLCKKLIHEEEQVDSYLHPYVKYALQEINTRYMDSTLSMKEIAENRSISPAYLGSLFKEQTGKLFNDYLLMIRLEKVLELLSDSKLNVGEIAEATGFTRQNYLNKVFRRKYGISPGEYRRKYWFGEEQ